MNHLINKIKNAGIEVRQMTPMQEEFLKKFSTRTNRNLLAGEIQRYVFECSQENEQTPAIKLGTLTVDGTEYLKKQARQVLPENMDIYLTAGNARKVVNDHFNHNEKDLLHNKPLASEDMKDMIDVIHYPDQIHASVDPTDGKQMFLFYKQKPDMGTVIVELELDRHASNLNISDYYISHKDIYRRFNEMDPMDSQNTQIDRLIGSNAAIPRMTDLTIPQKQVLASAEPFFSNAESVIYSIAQDKATPAQWLAMLQKAGGIKAGEDKWTGLSEWLKTNPEKSLTKSQVLQYIDSNRIVLHENHFHEMEKSPEFEKLNREFFSFIENIDDEYREADERIEEFYDLMKTKYDDDYLYYMSDDEREEEEKLHNERDKYDCTINSREDIAWNMMYDKYGTHFDYAFSYDSDGLSINDYDEAERFIAGSAIDKIRLENVTEGLVNYHEIALWAENAEQWQANDTIHFGEVGNGRNIGWVRFGETTVQVPLSADEIQKRIDAMPKPSEWTKLDGSQFVVKNDIYYPPGQDRFSGSAYISKSSEGRSFTYHPEKGSGLICMTLKEAVDLYNKNHVRKYDEHKVLVIDEVQSNRHQQGRKKGYQMSDNEMEKLREQLADAMKEKVQFQDSLKDKYGSNMFGHYATPEEIQRLGDLDEQVRQLLQKMQNDGQKIPAAPFETNWHELCMKRMLRYAAENGYDKMAWTKGEQQVNRYQISRNVKEIGRGKNQGEDKYITLTFKHGDETGFHVKPDGHIYGSSLGWNDKHVDEVFGKELAQKVLQIPECYAMKTKDLTIGGEGMMHFYDRILPNYMDKYGKRWSVRSSEIELPKLSKANGYDKQPMKMHCIDITDEMRESVLKGQPMFMIDREGHIYGYAMDDIIYLSSKGLNHETLVHEYTHLWAAAMQHGNPEGWQSVKDLLKATVLWDDVQNDLLYSDISRDENLVASEVLARISGSRNAARIAEAAVRTAGMSSSDNRMTHPADVYNSILRALETFWSWVGQHMFDIKRFNDVNEVTDRVLYDLLQGNHLETGKVMIQTEINTLSRFSNIQIFKGRGGQPHIRCKVDGVQQMGVPVKPQDLYTIHDKSRLPELAERYFGSHTLSNENRNSNKR